ncbi:MAG TPA: hypothetical protein PKY56_08095 [Candidatus Kapabacteria bacterium]|nr:hypothetical protein [Candidatus Kapabacteria bacterium]HPO62123.1 hypothetical protein [Candidatus Kapabacteria bacterium]
MKTTIIILSIIICLLLIFFFVNKNESKNIVTFQHDTLYLIKEAEPIVIEKAKTKIKYIKDTVFKSQPFVAELDTIVRQDTIHSSFIFPENLLSLEIKKKPDTTKIEKITITKEILQKESWWKEPLIFISGCAAGFLLFKLQ